MKRQGYLVCVCILGRCLLLLDISYGQVHGDPGTTNITAKQNWYDKLRKDLLEGYDKHALPVRMHNTTMSINFGLALLYVDLDEKNSKLIADCWMRMVWSDDKLSWDSSAYGGINVINMAAHELWKPDIVLYNSVGGLPAGPIEHTHMVLESNGQVIWVPPGRLHAYCHINLLHWPWDQHNCYLKFGSWTFDGDKIDINVWDDEKVDMEDFMINNTKWEVIENGAKKNKKYYPCCNEPYPDLTFNLKLKRKSPTYRAILVAPVIVVVAITLVSFWLPPTAGERIILAGFNFLVVCSYLRDFGHSLPERSDHTPIIVTFYSNTAVLVGVSIITSVISISMSRGKRQAVPGMLKRVLTGPMGRFLLLGRYIDRTSDSQNHFGGVELITADDGPSSSENEKLTRQSSDLDSRLFPHNDWILVAGFIDRITFLVYCVVFAITMARCF